MRARLSGENRSRIDRRLTEERGLDEQELANILKDMHAHGLAGKKAVAMVHWFGILYAGEIQACVANPQEIARKAGLGRSYRTEIRKGCVLAEHVTVHDGSILRWRE